MQVLDNCIGFTFVIKIAAFLLKLAHCFLTFHRVAVELPPYRIYKIRFNNNNNT